MANRYKKLQLRKMARRTMLAIKQGDPKGMAVVVGVTAKTGISPDQVIKNIRKLGV